MIFAPIDADYAKINPALAEDTQWQQTRGKLEYLLSDQGLRNQPENPFVAYLDEAKKRLDSAAMAAVAKDKGYTVFNGEYFASGEGGAKTLLNDEQKAALRNEAMAKSDEQLELHKKEILLNAARGYSKQDPMPAGNLIVEGGIGGAMGAVLSGDFSNIGGAFKTGILDGVKQFIMDIPYVGKFISQLNNWVGSHVGAMFGSGQEALSWEQAGKLADAQKASDKIGNGLSVYSGLNLEAVKSQISHSLTYEDGQQTAAPSPSTPAPTASANPTPAPAAETPPAPTVATGPAPAPTAPTLSQQLATIFEDNKLSTAEFAKIRFANSAPGDISADQSAILNNQNIHILQPEKSGEPVIFATKNAKGEFEQIHAVYSNGSVVHFEEQVFKSLEEIKKSKARGNFDYCDEYQDTSAKVSYDEIAAQVFEFAKKAEATQTR